MTSRAMACGILLLAAVAAANVPATPTLAAETTVGRPQETVSATPTLVREIQFMLLTLGIDPGPIDGNAQQLTNRAAHTFQARAGLSMSDVVNNGLISTIFLDRLRQEAAQVMFKNGNPVTPPAAASPASPPAVAASPSGTPAQPAPEITTARPESAAPDRFANCALRPGDLHIGAKQYTAQNYLDEGFDGSTARAVTDLRKRLDEARQLAEHIGGTALLEVQRQARVLTYFECRLNIEQASGSN
jgi:peptidoglycan hydrolase-like protein with peptidoglycan-binding domain